MSDTIDRIRMAKLALMTLGFYIDGAGNELKSTIFEDAAYEIERLRAKNAQVAWSRNAWKKQACKRQDFRNDELEELLAENERLKAENERLNTALSDVAYCDTPGENDEHCEREDGDLCPMWGWYDGPICSATGMRIGDDPRNP